MGSRTMKAVQLSKISDGSPPIFTSVVVPIPNTTPGYALVQVHYSSIQPSDRMNVKGYFPYTSYPRIPGRDYAGIVVEVGDDSDKSKSWIGKSVFGTSGSSLSFTMDGTNAQYFLIPQDALVEKPESMSLFQASTVGVSFTTALLCLQRASVGESDVVLVLGASGAVGTAVTQMARAIGCKKVFTAARRPDSDPDVILGSGSPASVLGERIPSLTGGRGVDVVIDTVGDLDLMSAAMEQLAQDGRYTWISAPKGGASTTLTFDVLRIYRKGLSLFGCNTIAHNIQDTATQLRSLIKWIDGGQLQAQNEADFRKVKLDDVIEDGYGKLGKVVIELPR
ncbi:hypothetical protein N7495_003651 [Penicillium taxi]|uniref:uncharacterized protein n=1 Tax=Penicillium taxi TaxID=168475 RepID=UPI0025459FBC|nr:uncharacterized protein N7495_003651 [Penicillium taxi]KAJ5898907.1 hypothetical protein N7495_003651 [Penicillium taxi]